jgi:hypothetical protein
MVVEVNTIEVEPDSELAKLLDEAGDTPLVLVKNGRRIRVTQEIVEERSSDPWASYDPEKFEAGIVAAAGSWADVDAEKLIADVYRWREEGSRPADRP